MPRKIKECSGYQESAQARGKRLRAARNLLGFSRSKLQKRHGLAMGSLQNWESARRGGLTEKGAKKMVQIYKAEGISCSFEWIMYGIGDPPQLTERILTLVAKAPLVSNEFIDQESQSELAQISKELMLFRQAYPDYIDMVVQDDAMLPKFIPGEFVAGRRCFGENIDTVLRLDCIVHLESGEILLRNVRQGTMPGFYTLVCSNTDTIIEKPMLYDVKLLSAAPVVWARRHFHFFAK